MRCLLNKKDVSLTYLTAEAIPLEIQMVCLVLVLLNLGALHI